MRPYDWLLVPFGFRPFRCYDCSHRYYAKTKYANRGANTPKKDDLVIRIHRPSWLLRSVAGMLGELSRAPKPQRLE